MGSQRVLQAARVAIAVAIAALTSTAHAEPSPRLAIVDLGPADDGATRKALQQAASAAGFDPLLAEPGLADALAGEAPDDDAVALTAALAAAQRAFGLLDCPHTIEQSTLAMGLAAARQASGLAVPELPRALVYTLLCSDRTGDHDAAQLAATRLRAIGAAPPEITATLWAKYPEVDAVIDRKLISVTIDGGVPGAVIYIDLQRAGRSPLALSLTTTEHVIGVATAERRGWALGIAVASQPTIVVPLAAHAGTWSTVAARIAGWRGTAPNASELAWVLAKVHATVALVRVGDELQLWGRAGFAGDPARLGGNEGRGPVADVERILSVATSRVQAWADHAPDPDRPLLLDDGNDPLLRERRDDRTRWWVYAAVIGTVLAGGTFLYLENAGTDVQHIQVHAP